jgi:putative ABC transport system ATP-binding protein
MSRTTGTAVVQTIDLRKEYRMGTNVVNALAGVSVRIEPGEFVAVMGPSGSGKTTFMNLLGCLDRPTAGKYLFEGHEVSAFHHEDLARLRNQKIGFVFQNFNLLPRITALDNVALPLAYGKFVRSERRKRAAQALEEVGLGERMDHSPVQLSGGQQQRVAIARAIVGAPSLILADEPTGALDSKTGVEIMAILQSLNARGITIVLVTHEHDIAEYAGRVLSFRDGRMIREEKGVGRRANAPATRPQQPHLVAIAGH